MPKPSPLFRAEALQAQRPREAGAVLLAAPPSAVWCSAAAIVVAVAVASLCVVGEYTRHAALAGRLVPQGGVVDVYASQPGVVVEKRAAEGDAVQPGDVLYVVSSELMTPAFGATRELAGRQIESRRASLLEELEETASLEAAERRSLERRIAALEFEQARTAQMIADQRERVTLAEEAAARYARPDVRRYVPREQLLDKREKWLEQRARLQSLEREASALGRQRADLDGELASLPVRMRARAAELERAVAAVDREIAENEARRRVAIIAPAAGVVTALAAEVGQVVDGSRRLLSIVPDGAPLEAHFYAPSGAIGFVDEGDDVVVRYPAYPYQRFGHHRGTVAAVSRTAVSSPEAPAADWRAFAPGEPTYRIVVRLASQAVQANGRSRPLRAGMSVEADVLLETRKLYEWALEPLYTATKAR